MLFCAKGGRRRRKGKWRKESERGPVGLVVCSTRAGKLIFSCPLEKDPLPLVLSFFERNKRKREGGGALVPSFLRRNSSDKLERLWMWERCTFLPSERKRENGKECCATRFEAEHSWSKQRAFFSNKEET